MSPFWYGQWPVTWFFSNISLGMGTKSVSHIPGGVWWNRLLGSSSCQDLWTVCGPYPEFYWLSILLPGTCLATFNVQVVNTPITLINMKFQDTIWTTKLWSVMQYCDVITDPRWRTAAILKIVKSPYLSEKSSDFDDIWYTTLDIEPDYSHVTKNWNF